MYTWINRVLDILQSTARKRTTWKKNNSIIQLFPTKTSRTPLTTIRNHILNPTKELLIVFEICPAPLVS